jgi:hypothetical protein
VHRSSKPGASSEGGHSLQLDDFHVALVDDEETGTRPVAHRGASTSVSSAAAAIGTEGWRMSTSPL